MDNSSVLLNKHLFLRAGFGITNLDVTTIDSSTPKKIWKELSKERPLTPLALEFDYEAPADYQKIAQLNADAKMMLVKKRREASQKLNLSFLKTMVQSEDQLREKMAFFWHGHFATRLNNPKFDVQLINIIREKALGNFKDLLFAVSKSPAMLQFLNNQQNKKGHPNENFAREVMELFTMGRGNYTETDIKEAARAYTGWGFKDGEFTERPNQHDTGTKTFLGKTGNFNGDDALNIILEQPVTAKFLTTKIYKFFVNEKPQPEIIDSLSERFRKSGYDIKDLMEAIFTSSWFYDKTNIGAKIKSPIELMVGLMRMLPMQIDNPNMLINFQRLLGQTLFSPPNVAGWPSGTAWIDSSTLLLRMQLPQIWSGLRPLDVKPLEDDDMTMGIQSLRNLQKTFRASKIEIDWSTVEKVFAGKDPTPYLLQHSTSLAKNIVNEFSGGSLKSKIIDLMSTPEYQLC